MKMNKQETVQLLAYLKGAYPNWGRTVSDDDAKAMVMVWYDMLGEYDILLIKAAVKGMLSNNEYPPSIAEVIKQLNRITETEPPMSEVEAWGMVKKAIRNSTYNSQAEFDKLPEPIKRTIGTHEILRSWAMEESDNTDKVIGSQFMRSFRTTLEREREYKALPNDVKQLIDSNMNKLLE